MNLVLTEPRVRLTCLSDPHMIETLDMDRLVDDLADGIAPKFLTPERICLQDLIVVATIAQPGAKSGAKRGASPERYVGVLGAGDGMAGGRAFLRLDMACVAPRARGQRLMSRLLARAAAERVERTSILAARTTTPSWFHALRHFAADLEGGTFHPAPAGGVVALRNAALARQIAAVLCPEHRYDVATGVLHGRCAVPVLKLRRHASADAWCEAARDTAPILSEELLAVIDLQGVAPATLLARAGQIASTG
jgi:GNAT superfamily N-acetyltransferase